MPPACRASQQGRIRRLRDELGPVFRDADFAGLYPRRRGQPALPPWKLALVTVMQFAEDLSGSLARAAGRARNGGETVSDLNDVLAVRRIKTSTM